MSKHKPWLRLYTGILASKKVHSLPDSGFRWLINMWAMARCNDGVLPSYEDIAWTMRVSERKAQEMVELLAKHHFFEQVGGKWHPHDWEEWQYESDVSTDRVKRFRERQRNVSETVVETYQSRDRSETDTEQRQKQSISPNGELFEFSLSPSMPKESAKKTWRSERFEEFWHVVWCKIGKGKAATAFTKAAKNETIAAQIIMAAITQGPWLIAQAKKENRSVIHPSTWLNGGRWEDEVPQIEEGSGW